MKYIPTVIATLLLMLMGILAGGAALGESITIDEGVLRPLHPFRPARLDVQPDRVVRAVHFEIRPEHPAYDD